MTKIALKILLHLASASTGFIAAIIFFKQYEDIGFLNRYLMDYSTNKVVRGHVESSYSEDIYWWLDTNECSLLELIYGYKENLKEADPLFLDVFKHHVKASTSKCEFQQKLKEYIEQNEI